MLYFSNPGLLPIRAATTMGVSVKEGDTPIGMFGTGLKYVIAGVLRLGGRIQITVGDKEHIFGTLDETIRGKEFSIVTMDDIPLGFTTEYGKTWEPWMYIRELWSNCQDENGTHGWSPQPGDTHVVIQCLPLEQAYNDRHKFLLEDVTPLDSNDFGEVHRRIGGQNAFFYRNIRVAELPETMLFNYNTKKHLPLTEDRTISYIWAVQSHCSDIVAKLTNKNLIRDILLAPDHTFEYRMLEARANSSTEFFEVLRDIFETSPRRLNKSYQRFSQNAWGDNSVKTRPATEFEQKKIDKALTVLRAIKLDKPFVLKICSETDQRVYGFAYEGSVYLTQKCLDEGAGQITTTLIEEYIHVNEGLEDYSREFQDRCLNLIVSLTEEHVMKEPL